MFPRPKQKEKKRKGSITKSKKQACYDSQKRWS